VASKRAEPGGSAPRDPKIPVVRIEKVVKTYKMGDVEVRALRGVSMDIFQGEFVAVMGTSGSGKSTLMNLLGCLDKPTSGSYALDGHDVSRLSRDQLAKVRGEMIGFVFQGFNLLPRTTALENVELPMLYQGVPGKERHRRAEEALAKVGLGDRGHHTPAQLSGGQQQRVAIARALVNNPRMILADEPTGNLDSKTSIEVMAIFQQLAEQGLTVLLVTHEPDIAGHARRVITFKDGLVLSDVVVAQRRDARVELARLERESLQGDAQAASAITGFGEPTLEGAAR
jgi:putative ABC transport system ATP-binding protein